MSHEHDQRVARLALIRKRHEDLVDLQLAPGSWSDEQRDRSELLDQVELLTAQLVVARIDIQLLKGKLTDEASAAEKRRRRVRHPCRCEHEWYAHAHYRRGTDCGLCSCTHYRPEPAPQQRASA